MEIPTPYFSKDRTNIFLQNVGTCVLYHVMSLFEVSYLEMTSTAMIIQHWGQKNEWFQSIGGIKGTGNWPVIEPKPLWLDASN